jgi:hypothetical protein
MYNAQVAPQIPPGVAETGTNAQQEFKTYKMLYYATGATDPPWWQKLELMHNRNSDLLDVILRNWRHRSPLAAETETNVQ